MVSRLARPFHQDEPDGALGLVNTMETSPEDKKSIMVIFAHPDDAEFTSGGTIAQWVADGHYITYVVCTDGSSHVFIAGTSGLG